MAHCIFGVNTAQLAELELVVDELEPVAFPELVPLEVVFVASEPQPNKAAARVAPRMLMALRRVILFSRIGDDIYSS